MGKGDRTLKRRALLMANVIGAALLGATFGATPVRAASRDGDPDQSFGVGGRRIVVRDAPDDHSGGPLFQLAPLAGGGVQTALRHHWDGSILVLRFDAHGEADARFGADGRVEISTCHGVGNVAIATPADGGALVWTGECLVRLSATGALDPAFGDLGVVAVGGGRQFMAMDDIGRIVVAGLDATGLLARRYLADGRIDATFGDAGSARLDFSIPSKPGAVPSEAQAYALALGAEGTITVGGRYYAPLGGGYGILLLKLRDDGTPETAFGSGGLVLHSTSALADYAWVDGLVPLGDGSLMVAGPANCNSTCLLLGRFTATGSVDASFGLKFLAAPASLDFVTDAEQRHAMARLPDGRILVGFAAWHPPLFATRTDLMLLRFLPDGTPDTGFGESGWRTYTTEDPCATCGPVNPSESYDRFHDFVVADGKVTLLGRVFFEQSTADTDYITLTRVQMDDVFGNGFE